MIVSKEEGKLEMRLAESLQMAKALRDSADYDNIFDKDSSLSLVDQAVLFVKIAKDVVSKQKTKS